jgi:serine/threonine protein kinase
MGEVFLARKLGTGGFERDVALKTVLPVLTGHRKAETFLKGFVDEARVVVTLNHANICSVFDVGRVPGATGPAAAVDEYYLAMEYVAGTDLRTLHDRWRQRSLIPDAAVIVHIVCEVLKALDYAHRRRHPVTGEPLQLVHRDVSPQNVLVSYEGEIKLIDLAWQRAGSKWSAPHPTS